LTKPKADLLQGTLDLLILKALNLGPLHGYGAIQRLRQLSDELLAVEQGSLYSAVYLTRAARLQSVPSGGRQRPAAGQSSTRLLKQGVNNSMPRKRVGIGSPWPLRKSAKAI
jgi:hypothetical protein